MALVHWVLSLIEEVVLEEEGGAVLEEKLRSLLLLRCRLSTLSL